MFTVAVGLLVSRGVCSVIGFGFETSVVFGTSGILLIPSNGFGLMSSRRGMGSSGSVGGSLLLLKNAVSGALWLCSVIGVFAFILAMIPACARFANGLELFLWLLVLRGMRLPGLGVL